MSSSAQDRQLLQQMLSGREPLQEALLAWKEGSALEEALRRLRLLDPGEGTVNDDATGIHVSAGAGAPLNLFATERYRKVRSHARGGLGEVFVAHDAELDRDVALKEIQEQHADDAASQERFVREARLTGQLEHPGIVPVYGLGLYPDGRPYYAMRFIGGEPMSEAIKRYHALQPAERPLPLRQLLGRFVAVCNAVAFAHSRGVIHRDIKPANAMLGEFGETLVVDWGLAKATGERQPPVKGADDTAPSIGTIGILGTPAYMAPEQASGDNDRVGPASDIYSLGATLYQILTGQVPIAPGEVSDMLRKVVKREYPTPRQANADVPRALEAVVLKAMAPKVEERYTTVRELAAEVERWLADEPVSAHREPWLDRARRWGRKHRTLVTGAVVFLLVGVIALSGALAAVAAEQRKTANERDRANEERDRANVAKQEARDNLKQSEVNLALAKKAVDECFGVARDDARLQLGQMKGVKKLLLEKALPFYKRFQALRPGASGASAELAEQHFRVGYITSEIGNNTEARNAYRQAERLFRTLVEGNHADRGHQNALGATLLNLGNLLQREGKRSEALAAYTRAREIYAKLVKADPEVTAYRQDLARTLTNIGGLLSGEGKRGAALAAYSRAGDIQSKLAEDNPASAGYQNDLAMTLTTTGALLKGEGKDAAALAAYRRACDIGDKLVKAHPAVPEYQHALAGTLNNMGLVLNDRGKRKETLAAYTRARAIKEKLVRANPFVLEYQNALGHTLINIGGLLQGERKYSEALGIYRQARDIRMKLLESNPAVADYQAGLALALYNMGLLLQREGKPGEALKTYTQARDIGEKLVEANPAVLEYQRGLAKTLLNMGVLLQGRDKRTEAHKAYKQARDLLEKVVKANPAVGAYQNDLAKTLLNTGLLLKVEGKPTEALVAYSRARDIREKLVKANPKVTDYQNDLVKTFLNIGLLLQAQGKGTEALAAFAQARAIGEKLVEGNSEVVEYRTGLARVCGARGILLLQGGKAKEARTDLDAAIEQLLRVRKRDLGSAEAKQVLLSASYHRAVALGQLKRHGDALPDWDRALEMTPANTRLFLRKGRADCLARAGEYQPALREGQALARTAPPAVVWYDLARIAALASAGAATDATRPLPWRERFAEGAALQSMAWLQAAHKAGFFKTEAKRTQLVEDADFVSLCHRADFKVFVASLTPK